MLNLGDSVKTPYGEGVVVDLRHNQVVVRPTTWSMANGQKATFYMNPKDVEQMFRIGDVVRTVFGVGEVQSIRPSDGFYIVVLRDWKLASGQSPVLYLEGRAIRLECAANAKMPPFAKDDYVRTPYGTGRVQNVRCDGIVIVRPDEWKLACDIIPTFYMNASYVTKAEPKQPVVEAKQPTFDEKFAVAKEVKDEGNRLFKNKQFEEAKDKYAEAISALNTLGDIATDEQRSHLFEQAVSCHNNLAVCFLRLQRYLDAFNMARSALYLIEAFERLYPHSKLWQYMLSRGFSIEILSKVWKKKALFLMGKACFLKQDFEEAVEHLERALALINGDPNLAAEVKEVVELLTQAKQKIQKQSKAEKDMWKKAFTKQQEEENAAQEIVDSIAASGASPVPIPAATSAPKTNGTSAAPAAPATASGKSAAAGLKKKPKSAKKKEDEEASRSGSGLGWNLPTVLGAAAIGVAAVATVAGIAMMRKK